MSVWDYSITAGDNASVPGVNLAEGQAPSSLNDSMRAVLSNIAENTKLTTAQYTSAGTADTQTLSPSPSWTAYSNGQRVLFKVGAALTNTGTATLNVSSLGAKTVYRQDGTTTLSAGDLTAGSVVEVVYDSAINGFRLLTNSGNFGSLAVSGNATVGGTLGVTGVASFADGSVSAPSITNTGDTNTGLYFPAADTVAIAAGGVDVARFNTAATGVNYLDFYPAAANGVVSIRAAGSDTNLGLDIRSKGADPIQLIVGSLEALRVTAQSSAVNYWQMTASATGSALVAQAAGTDTNIPINIVGKGTGQLQYNGFDFVDYLGDVAAARISTNLAAAYNSGAKAGSILQSVFPAAYQATTAITTQLPADDTVPTSSEGDEILSQAITPVSSANKVRVRINGFGSHASGQRLVWAIFRGTTYIAGGSAVSVSSYAVPFVAEVTDVPGTTSATTYSLRVGPGGAAETVRLNYDYALGSRLFGGSASVNMVLEEIKG